MYKVMVGFGVAFFAFAAWAAITGDDEGRRTSLGMLAALGVVAFIWWVDHVLRVEPRQRAMQAEARRLGLSYEPGDEGGLRSLPFDLFGRGTVRDVTNVLSGTRHGVAVVAFEYRWATEDDEHLYSCAILPIPVRWPTLVLKPETGLSLLAGDAGIARDVRLEWEEFNRVYRVRSSDRRFATAVLDGRMMEWLLGLSPRYGFELAEGRLLAYTARVHPWEIGSVLDTATAFRERIPSVAASMFGGEPPPRPDEREG